MRIGFDIRPFLRDETGVGVYFKNLLFSLARIDKENEYFLFSSSMKDRLPQSKIPQFEKMRLKDFRYPVRVVNFFLYRFGWPRLDDFFRTELDLTHSPHPLLLSTRGRKIVTVHDLFFLDFPERVDKDARKVFRKRIEHSLHNADGVLSVSRFTAGQVIQRFSVDQRKVKVVYHGINRRLWRDVSDEEIAKTKKKWGLPSSYLLFVGALEPRKNIGNLLRAFKLILEKRPQVFLVLLGPEGLDSEAVRKEIKELDLRFRVKRIGYVAENELRCIYRSATVFVFPSLWEGFGLPLLEAMASGLPIAASEKTAIPEVAADAALYFNPEETEDIADKVIRILENEDLRRTLVSLGNKRIENFDWERTAGETLDFYREVVSGK